MPSWGRSSSVEQSRAYFLVLAKTASERCCLNVTFAQSSPEHLSGKGHSFIWQGSRWKCFLASPLCRFTTLRLFLLPELPVQVTPQMWSGMHGFGFLLLHLLYFALREFGSLNVINQTEHALELNNKKTLSGRNKGIKELLWPSSVSLLERTLELQKQTFNGGSHRNCERSAICPADRNSQPLFSTLCPWTPCE